jgi:hypothetical protein
MITEDIETTKKIFEIIHPAIDEDYESFEFAAFVREGYLETKLWITAAGVRSVVINKDINYAIVCDLIDDLKENGLKRGDDWKAFIMTYTYGGQVKVKFDY